MFWRSKKGLYKYSDGDRNRRIDPLYAYRQLHSHETFRLDTHPVAVDMGDNEAVDITLGAIRDVFGVQAYDPDTGRGLPEAETLALFEDFCYYIESLKKNTSTSQIAPPATGSTSADSNSGITSASPPSGSSSTARHSDRRTTSAAG